MGGRDGGSEGMWVGGRGRRAGGRREGAGGGRGIAGGRKAGGRGEEVWGRVPPNLKSRIRDHRCQRRLVGSKVYNHYHQVAALVGQ